MENPGAQSAPRSHHHHLRPLSTSAATSAGGGGGGREDCWSEGATEILVEAWGDRYLQLNRGNLRHTDWKEVADAVNARHDGVRPRKSDAQCKNRVDTLKKKYKLERSKPLPSKWPFYARLDRLIGSVPVAPGGSKNPPPARRLQPKLPSVTFTVKPCKGKLNPNPNPKVNSAGSTESSGNRHEHDEDEIEDVASDLRARKHRMEPAELSDGATCRDLARAIVKLGEIYERIESSKQQRMMELEKERLEFTKDLEFQRMRMFMETQLELERMKRRKYASPSVSLELELLVVTSETGAVAAQKTWDMWSMKAQLRNRR